MPRACSYNNVLYLVSGFVFTGCCDAIRATTRKGVLLDTFLGFARVLYLKVSAWTVQYEQTVDLSVEVVSGSGLHTMCG